MDLIEILRALFGLGLVLGLIIVCGVFLRKAAARGFTFGPQGSQRLSLSARLAIDPRRTVVILRDGAREHLILLGATGETVLESRDAPTAGEITPGLRLVEPGSQV